MPDNSNQAALAAYLTDVTIGQRSLQALLDQPGAFTAALEPCFHGLQHYAADADLREKDEAYRAMQDDELRRMINLLNAGASAGELRRITFLPSSS